MIDPATSLVSWMHCTITGCLTSKLILSPQTATAISKRWLECNFRWVIWLCVKFWLEFHTKQIIFFDFQGTFGNKYREMCLRSGSLKTRRNSRKVSNEKSWRWIWKVKCRFFGFWLQRPLAAIYERLSVFNQARDRSSGPYSEHFCIPKCCLCVAKIFVVIRYC